MKAAVCREFGKPLTVEDIAIRKPRANEVEVSISACAVCHSDIHYLQGAWGGPVPAVFGHEAAGRISALGSSVNGFEVGDAVLVTLLRNCGQCLNCINGMPARCERTGNPLDTPLSDVDGTPVAQGLLTAAFAEIVVVHETQIASVPADIGMDVACLLSCGVITGVGSAVNTARIFPGSAVAVIGAGGVGLNAIQGAKVCGAKQIIAVDISEKKLKDAVEFGATHGVMATIDKPHRKIKEITGGRGVDFALVAVGATEACSSALRFLSQGGKLVIVGLPPSGAELSFEPVILATQSQSIEGSNMGDTVLKRDIPWLLDLYRQGRLLIDPLITGRYSLEEINEAIDDTLKGSARRNVIVFDGQA